jgi:multidrug resistance protein MdtO
VSREGVISAVQWEDRFLKFLKAELTPTTERWRATARIVVACLITTVLVMAMHAPFASYAFITIFMISQANAGASLSKATLRILGTAVGAAVGIVAYIAFLDNPWLRVAFMGPLAAFFIFLSQTTTAPYFGLLAGVTAIMVMTATGSDAESGLHVGLWRFAMVLFGAIIGTAAQIFLWPSDPEKLLIASLVERLDTVEKIILSVRNGRPMEALKLEAALLPGLTRQLELLDNAEARHAFLRSRHAEQIALIGGIEQLLTAAFAFATLSGDQPINSSQVDEKLFEIAAACARLRDALQNNRPLESNTLFNGTSLTDNTVASASTKLWPGLMEMEHILSELPNATGFLDRDRQSQKKLSGGLRLDSPTRGAFFTPAFSLQNTSALIFSLRAGLAATLAYIIYQGLHWPGLSTSVWTTILIAQSTLGASVQKAILRLGGAILGGAIGIATIVWLMPNMDTLTPLLIVVAVCATISLWIATGSVRISYFGIQMGIAFVLCALNDLGPTTDLVPARDRVLGVLLGIIVSGLVFLLTGTAFAGTLMQRSLANALRSLGGLAHVGLHGKVSNGTLRPARGWRWKVYQDLATTLRLHDESKFEWGAGVAKARAERARIMRIMTETQSVFLAMLTLVHHRLTRDLSPISETLRKSFHVLANGIVLQLEAVANRTEGKSESAPPLLAPLIEELNEMVRRESNIMDPAILPHLQGRLALYKNLVHQLEKLNQAAVPPN